MSLSTANDIYSPRREITTDSVENLIPILYGRRGHLQDAVGEAVEFIAEENEKLDDASERPVERWGSNKSELPGKLQKYYDGCRHLVSRTTSWSLRFTRYKLIPGDDRVVTVPLGSG